MNNIKFLLSLGLFISTLSGCTTVPEEKKATPSVKANNSIDTVVAKIDESDDIGFPGNDIESVLIAIKGSDLVVLQTHKAAKDEWHRIRVYLNVNNSDTTNVPIAEGATSLNGLNADYGYSFEYTGNGWNTMKQEVNQGKWKGVNSSAKARGGKGTSTVLNIPLSEIGNPSDITKVKMMFVGTGNNWGTDQVPNAGMYDPSNP